MSYIVQKDDRRIKQSDTGWIAQQRLFLFWVNLCVTDLNGVPGTVEFSSLRKGLKWLEGRRVIENIKY